MTIQEQAKSEFKLRARRPNSFDVSTLLAQLGNELRRTSGYAGELRSVHDLLDLDDSTAQAALRIIPTLWGEQPSVDMGLSL